MLAKKRKKDSSKRPRLSGSAPGGSPTRYAAFAAAPAALGSSLQPGRFASAGGGGNGFGRGARHPGLGSAAQVGRGRQGQASESGDPRAVYVQPSE
jgi:hypothetical protein